MILAVKVAINPNTTNQPTVCFKWDEISVDSFPQTLQQLSCSVWCSSILLKPYFINVNAFSMQGREKFGFQESKIIIIIVLVSSSD